MIGEREGRVVDALGQALLTEFEDAAALRRPYEDEWVEALRQYKGVYPPEVLSALCKDGRGNESGRSKIFLRLTKVKCDAIQARLMDLLFPANGAVNWEIQPTPVPVIPQFVRDAAYAKFAARGVDVAAMSPDALDREIAAEACGGMRRTMRDQLAETPNRMSYRKVCDAVISQAVRYGTGVLKGPLVETRIRTSYAFDQESGRWGLKTEEAGVWPFFEAVPVWSVFPDLAATAKPGLRFIWQEHLMTARELLDLDRFPKFDAAAIRRYVAAHPGGDAAVREYERRLRDLSDEFSMPELKGRFRVRERWGYLTGEELSAAGVELPEEQKSEVFSSNVWLLGSVVIKAVLNPLQGTDLPYFFYHFSKDESSFFGDGAPRLIRDCQSGINAAVRMLVDNAAISSGPIVGMNAAALSSNQDVTALRPWSVYLFDDARDMDEMMRVWNLQSNSQDLVTILGLFQNFADELSTPRYMYGDQNVGGAGKTASGLSMLMGAANIAIKSLVKSFDDDITIPFITALYHWNMQWAEDAAIKGDYAVAATGSTNLVARELRAQQHQILLGVTSNPRFEGMTKDAKWLEHVFRDAEMPEGIVRTDEEYKAWKQEQMAMQAKAQTDALVQSLMEQAARAGLDPQAALSQVFGAVAPMLAQGAQAPGVQQ